MSKKYHLIQLPDIKFRIPLIARSVGFANIMIISIFIISQMLYFGCMTTTEPESEKKYNLLVRVILRDTANQANNQPLSNVNIQVYDAQTASAQPQQSLTNAQGIANFQLVLPLTGRNINVFATYNNQTQSKTNLLICNDTIVIFIFDTTSVQSVSCGSLNGSDSLIFIDDFGSRLLRQNTPANINRYESCWGLTNSSATETINVTIPAVSQPFNITSIIVGTTFYSKNTTNVDVPPGSRLSICFSVPTTQSGTFNQAVNLILRCGTNQGNLIINLRADIVPPSCLCEDLPDNFEILLPQRTQVGTSTEHTETVLTNTLNCDITVSQVSFDDAGSWTILSPPFPQTIKPGVNLTLRVRFNPNKAGKLIGTLKLTIRVAGTQTDCNFDVRLNSNGCNITCPLYSEDGVIYRAFGAKVIDTLSNRADNRIMVSITDNPQNPMYSTASKSYYFLNPDSACNSVTITINNFYADNYARQYFQVTPQSLTLAPGEFGIITVTFTAPDLNEMENIIQQRGGTNLLTSPDIPYKLFMMTIQILSASCNQDIEENAVVTIYPEISPIINLRAYSQRTQQKPEPENEVYLFGNTSRTILKGPGGSLGPYPPNTGNIFIDVNDTLASASPPQEPILKIINNSAEVKLWRTGYAESVFSNVPQLYQDFSGDPNYNIGYGPGPITNIQVGNVYAFKFSETVYALIYIRRVDNGTENTSSKQSGIEFRAVYPIYIP